VACGGACSRAMAVVAARAPSTTQARVAGHRGAWGCRAEGTPPGGGGTQAQQHPCVHRTRHSGCKTQARSQGRQCPCSQRPPSTQQGQSVSTLGSRSDRATQGTGRPPHTAQQCQHKQGGNDWGAKGGGCGSSSVQQRCLHHQRSDGGCAGDASTAGAGAGSGGWAHPIPHGATGTRRPER
jgi:hypothetical protein